MTARYKAHNLLPNPKPLTAQTWKFSNADNPGTPSTITWEPDGGMTLTSSADSSGAFCHIAKPNTLENGQYVIRFDAQAHGDVTYNSGPMMYTGKLNWAPVVIYKPDYVTGTHVIRYTVSDGMLYLRMFAPNNATSVTYRHFLLCTESDWETLQAVGVSYFDGDTIIRT